MAVAISPLVLSIVWFQMRARCPAYEPATSEFCAATDLFVGISGVVMFYVCIGALVLVALFVISALRAKAWERSSSALGSTSIGHQSNEVTRRRRSGAA